MVIGREPSALFSNVTCRYLLTGSLREMMPRSASCRIAIAVKVLVSDATPNGREGSHRTVCR